MSPQAALSEPVAADAIVSADDTLLFSRSLPEAAYRKLLHLHAIRDDARELLETAQAKVDAFRAPFSPLVIAQREVAEIEKTNYGKLINRKLENEDVPKGSREAVSDRETARAQSRYDEAHARLANLVTERDAATAHKDERSKVWRSAMSLTSRIEEWLKKSNTRLRLVPVEPLVLAKGQTAAAELESARELLVALAAERKRVERASVPAADAKRRARDWVTRQAARVHVSGLLAHDGTIHIGGLDDDSGVGLMAWLDPDRLVRRLEREIDEQIEGRFALSELDQVRELAALDVKVLATERKEEALVLMLEASGASVLRRAAASPMAVLGVE